MLRIIALRMKEMLLYSFVFIPLMVCLLALSYVSSEALNRGTFPPSLAIYDADGGEDSACLIAMLSERSEYSLIDVDTRNDAERMLSKRLVSGLLVIEPGFSERLLDKGAVDFFPAVGATEAKALSEYVAGAILQLRAQYKLNSVLLEMGVPPVELEGNIETVLSVEYIGNLNDFPALNPPRHGVALLFFLLSWAHAATSLRVSNRIRSIGQYAAMKTFFSSAVSVFIVWTFLVFVYFLFLKLIYGYSVSAFEIASFLALLLFNIGFGGLFAASGKGVLFIIPYVLLNMSVGGGLWENISAPMQFRFITPLASALSGCAGSEIDILTLFAQGASMIFIGGGTYVLQKLWTQRNRLKRLL